MIQTSPGGWKSFYNLTYAELYGLTLVGGYLGNIVILAVPILLCMYTVTFALVCPFIIRVYKKTQIK